MHDRRPWRSRALRTVGAVLLALTSTLVLEVAQPLPAGAALAPDTLNIGAYNGQVPVLSGHGYIYKRDGAFSVKVANNKSFWVFADTMRFSESGVLMDGSLQGVAAIADDAVNPALTFEGLTSKGALQKFMPGAKETCPGANDFSFAWPSSIVGVPQSDPNKTLIVIYYRSLCGPPGPDLPTPKHIGVATYLYDAANPNAPLVANVLQQNLFPVEPGYGEASVLGASDNLIYLYACSGTPCRIARVHPSFVGVKSAYRYWNGSTWDADAAKAVDVTMASNATANVSVQWIPQLNRYVAMTFNGYADFSFRYATDPVGPWSARSSLHVDDCEPTCMTTSIHAALSTESALALTFVTSPDHIARLTYVPVLIAPVGSYESVTTTLNGARVKGWAIDPDTTAPVTVSVMVDGTSAGTWTADELRSDVAASYPGYGPNHGFTANLSLSAGSHNVCVTAQNLDLGAAATSLGCKTVSVYAPPSAPRNATAHAGDAQAVASWLVPTNAGGVPASQLTYEVTVEPPITGSPFTTPPGQTSLVVNGLSNNTSYTFSIAARNVLFKGPSATTAAVTPHNSDGARFHPMAPERFLDSRTGTGWSGQLSAGAPKSLQVTGRSGIPATASAVVINVTATGSTANSFLTVWPNGQSKPNASNLNFASGQTIPNLATVRIGNDGKIAFATEHGATDVVGDVVGYYDYALPSDLFNPMSPTRILDSRVGPGWTGKLSSGTARPLKVTGGEVPATATAVVMNVTATNGTKNSFLTVYPAGQALPNASNLNFAAGQTIPNLVTVKVGTNGNVMFANANGSTDVVADIVGWYGPSAGQSFHTLVAPTRVLDDRSGIGGYTSKLPAPFPRNVTMAGDNGIPDTAGAVVANTTVTESTADSFLTVYPTGQPKPNASNLNFATGQTIPNLVIAKTGLGGKLAIATEHGSVTVIMDVTGYFAPD